MNRKYTILFIVILIMLLSACSSASNDNINGIEPITGYGEGKADMEGIVLNIGERGIKLARNLSPNEYDEIKNESVTKLHNEDVAGERESLGLIDLIYENKKEFNKGDKVDV